MADVNLKKLKKNYDKTEVIHGVDLDIRSGEFIVFVGPSGCGKSTLLRMIAGLEDITEGEISIGGEVVNKIIAAERGVAMVFQSYALYPHMTVFDNMSFALKQAKRPKDEIQSRVLEAAKILQIENLRNKPFESGSTFKFLERIFLLSAQCIIKPNAVSRLYFLYSLSKFRGNSFTLYVLLI